jgi:GntR family transcriptional regulator
VWLTGRRERITVVSLSRTVADAVEARTPQYLKIYRELKRQIDAGELGPGAQLPPQRVLSQRFAVTLMTLRQALALLDREGLVESRQGRGTYVARPRVSYELRSLRSLAQELAAQGAPLATRVLELVPTAPSPRAAELLEVARREKVVTLERLRLVDGTPIVFQRSQLPLWIGRELDADALSRGSLYDFVEQRLGVRVVRAREVIHPVTLAASEARLLQVEESAPSILSERVTYTDGNRPIIYDEAFMPGDRIVIAAERYSSDLTVGYELQALAKESPLA